MSIWTRAIGLRTPALTSKTAPKGTLATTQGWSLPDHPLPDRFSGEVAVEQVYGTNVYAYRCMETIANSITSCPWRAGDSVTNNYKLDYPLARLLGPAPGGPNPNWSSAGLLRHAITSYMLLGKFAWVIEKDAVGRVVGLWPLRAQHLRPVPATSGPDYFKQFNYNNKGNANYQEYQPDEIVYIWRPAMADFRQPESPVQVANLNINISRLLDKFDYNFLKNGAVPSSLVVTPPWANDTERQGFQAQFLADFSGPANAGKTMFAEREIEGESDPGYRPSEQSVDVKTLATNQRDAELNIMRKAENMAICVAFGVPMSILGDSTAVTFSNAFQDRRNFWLECLLPRSREIQDGINKYLAPALGKEVGWFDTSGIPELRGDPAIPDAQAVAWVQADLVTADEVRADRGLPPGADVGLDKVWAQKKADAAALAESMAAGPPQPAPDSLIKQAGGTGAVAPQKAPSAASPAASRADTTDSSIRHGGHEGHRPLPGGHTKYSVLEDILTAQLRLLLGDMSESTRQRLASRRAKQGVLPDTGYWKSRAKSYLEPTLRALECTNLEQTIDYVVDSEINSTFEDSAALDQRVAEICADILHEDNEVSVVSVASTLMRLHSGDIDLDGALQTLELRDAQA